MLQNTSKTLGCKKIIMVYKAQPGGGLREVNHILLVAYYVLSVIGLTCEYVTEVRLMTGCQGELLFCFPL